MNGADVLGLATFRKASDANMVNETREMLEMGNGI